MPQIPAQAKQLYFHATSLHDTTKPRVMEQTRPMQHTNAYNGVNSWKSKRKALLTQSKPRCHDANSFTSKIPVLTSRTFLAVRKDIQSISKHQSLITIASSKSCASFFKRITFLEVLRYHVLHTSVTPGTDFRGRSCTKSLSPFSA